MAPILVTFLLMAMAKTTTVLFPFDETSKAKAVASRTTGIEGQLDTVRGRISTWSGGIVS